MQLAISGNTHGAVVSHAVVSEHSVGGVTLPALPKFDMHKVEEALRNAHNLWGGKPMQDADITDALVAYSEFLRDVKINGPREVYDIPTEVDRVWHTHICQTTQYEIDVTGYLGFMLHHSYDICDGGVED